MNLDVPALVSTVGFPIVAFLIVYIDLRKKVEDLGKSIDGLNDTVIKLCARVGLSDVKAT